MNDDSKAIVPLRQELVVAISRQLAITEKLVLQISAEHGDAEAQYKLGEMYFYEGDLEEAVKWYHMAAQKGHAGAEFMLGHVMYSNGDGEPEDYPEAVKWFRKAADQGHAEAQYNLGVAYSSGDGVPQDDSEAIKWYLKAAEQGHADAQHSLGAKYEHGCGDVPPESKEAERDYIEAKLIAGSINPFDSGWESVRGGYIEAAKWYRKAAKQGHARAQNNLGKMYENGRGVPHDYVQAAKWYRKAAEQNLAGAQHKLGNLYYFGHGVSQDYVQALMWFTLAAADMSYMRMLSHFASAADLEQNDLEEIRDDVIETMTPAQLAEAQRLAKEWTDRLYASMRKSYRS